MERNIKLTLTLVVLFTYGQVATDLYLPSLISIANALNTNSSMVQFSITVYATSMMITQPFYGIASDAFGRRPLLKLGMIIAIIGSILCLLTADIQTLLIGRFLQGLGCGVTVTVTRAVVRDLYAGQDLVKKVSTLAIYGMTFMITAPILGGYIEHYLSWQSNFLILLLIALFNIITICFILPETNLRKNRDHLQLKTIKNNFICLLTSQKFMGYGICSTIAYANIFAWITAGPILLQETYGLNPIYFGWSYFLAGIFYIAGNILNRSLFKKYGITSMISVGFITQLVTGVGLLLVSYLNTDNIYTIVPLLGMLMFGAGIVFPNTNAAALNDFTNISGTASAMFSVLQSFGAVLSSSYIAIMPEQTLIPIATCFSILSFVGLAINLYINRESQIAAKYC